MVVSKAPRSSIVGSIALNDGRYPWMAPAYGASKAALNFLTRDYAKDLGREGFTVIPLYPGVNSSTTELIQSGLKLDQHLEPP